MTGSGMGLASLFGRYSRAVTEPKYMFSGTVDRIHIS